MSTHDPVPLDALLAHRAFVTALARALVRDPGAADDLAQQAWVAAIEHPPATGGSLRGWFARVLRNARRDAWRSGVRRERRESDAPPHAPEPSPDEIVARAEIHRRVVLAVFALEEPHRGTVILRFFEGLDATGIAAREGVPPATVRKRLERALDQLRARLDTEDGGKRDAWIAALAPLVAGAPAGAPAQGGEGCAGESPPDRGADTGTRGTGASSDVATRIAPIRRWGAGTSITAAVLVAGLGAALWALIPDDGDGAATGRRDLAGADGSDDGSGARGASAGSGRRRATGASATVPTSTDIDTAAAPAPPVAPEPAADVTVTVTTPTGDPAVGATVTLLRMLRDPGRVSYTIEVPDPPALPVAASERTDRDGRATLTGLVRADYALTAEAAGLAGATPQWIRPGKEPQAIRMLLRRAGVVTGRVTDAATGAPADAEVAASSTRDAGPADAATWRRVRTDADGTFRIDRVPQGTVRVVARRPGGFFAGGTLVALDGDGATARAEVKLAPVADVAGTAIDDATGEPVEGAALDAIVMASTGAIGFPTRAPLVTGPAGRFELRGVPVGATVHVVCTDEGPWKAAWPAAGAASRADWIGHVTPDGCTGLVVRMLRPAAIQGIVTTADGRPAAGAEVVVIGTRRGVSSNSVGVVLATTRADADGTYRVGGLAPGRIEVFARCGNGHSDLPMSGTRQLELSRVGAEGDPRIALTAGAVAHIDLRLLAGCEIRGRVVRADGTPAPGAWVYSANRHVASEFAATADTDADGRFVLRAVPVAGPPIVVGAWLPGGGTGGRADVPDRAAEVTIRAGAPGATDIALSGRVVGPDGAVVPSARVVLVETPGDDDALPSRFARYLDRSDGRLLPLRDDGTFSIDGVHGQHRDRFLLVASARGFLPGATMVPVKAGARITDIVVALRSGTEIRGVLRDAAGAPVAGMPVRAAPAPRGNIGYDGTPPTGETGADGSFRLVVEPDTSFCICFGPLGDEVLALPSAPPGRGIVDARLPADAKPRSVATAEAMARAQRSPRGAAFDEIPADWVRVEGRVVGADGKGVEGAHVAHVVSDGRGRASRGTSTDAGGRFSIPVPPGAVGTLAVDARERGVAAREGVAAGAGPVEIRVAPRMEPILRGVVRDADRAPVAGVMVACVQWSERGRKLSESIDVNDGGRLTADRSDLRIVRTDADGAYSVASLPTGRWTVYAGRPGTPWTPADIGEVDVTDGAQDVCDRDLRVERGHILRARLLDAGGHARRREKIHVVRAKSAAAAPVEFLVWSAADADGIVEVNGLPPGPWRVSLNGGGAAPVDVPESAEPVDLRL